MTFEARSSLLFDASLSLRLADGVSRDVGVVEEVEEEDQECHVNDKVHRNLAVGGVALMSGEHIDDETRHTDARDHELSKLKTRDDRRHASDAGRKILDSKISVH